MHPMILIILCMLPDCYTFTYQTKISLFQCQCLMLAKLRELGGMLGHLMKVLFSSQSGQFFFIKSEWKWRKMASMFLSGRPWQGYGR